MGASDLAVDKRRRIGIADPHQHIEQRRRHQAAQRQVVGRLGVGLGIGELAALLRDLGALRPHLALDLRDAFIDRGEIRRRGAVAARRGFHIVDGGREFVALRPRCREFGAQRGDDFSSASMRAAAAGSGTGLPTFGFESGDTRGETVDGGAELRSRRRGRG